VSAERIVLVPRARVVRWFDNFGTRHGAFGLSVADGALVATASDGAVAAARLPFDRSYDGPPDAAAFTGAVDAELTWGVLLVRKGGFAVARLRGAETLESKVGQRHVQGRTKAGGQSQQRFSRRRDNQARQAYEAAAEHTHRILSGSGVGAGVAALVCGGDRVGVDAVLSEPRLAGLAAVRTGLWLDVPDPRRGVLEQAVVDARAVVVRVSEPEDEPAPLRTPKP
jgi:hypothetical protein